MEFSETPISHTLWANLHFHEVYEVPEGAKLEAVRSFSDLLSNGYQQRIGGATVVEITENHHAIATDANAYERMLIDRSAINTRPHEVGQFIVQDGSQQRRSPLIHGQAGHLQIPATMQTEILDRLLPKSETGTERELTLHLYHTHPVPEFIIHHLNVIEERFRRRGRTNRQVALFPVSVEDIELAQAISQTYPRVRVIIHATTSARITYSVGFQNGNPIRISRISLLP